jgi:hypothetical protein
MTPSLIWCPSLILLDLSFFGYLDMFFTYKTCNRDICIFINIIMSR